MYYKIKIKPHKWQKGTKIQMHFSISKSTGISPHIFSYLDTSNQSPQGGGTPALEKRALTFLLASTQQLEETGNLHLQIFHRLIKQITWQFQTQRKRPQETCYTEPSLRETFGVLVQELCHLVPPYLLKLGSKQLFMPQSIKTFFPQNVCTPQPQPYILTPRNGKH